MEQLELSAGEWEYIFRALHMTRRVFHENPVVEDVLGEDRFHFIDGLSHIMDKIGVDGKEAAINGVAPIQRSNNDSRRKSE